MSLVSAVCCQADHSVRGMLLSVVCINERHHKASIMIRSWPSGGGCCSTGKNKSHNFTFHFLLQITTLLFVKLSLLNYDSDMQGDAGYVTVMVTFVTLSKECVCCYIVQRRRVNDGYRDDKPTRKQCRQIFCLNVVVQRRVPLTLSVIHCYLASSCTGLQFCSFLLEITACLKKALQLVSSKSGP